MRPWLTRSMVLMGALAHLVHMPQEYLADFVNVRFKGRDAVVKANLEALDLGRQHVAEETPIGDVGTPKKPDYDQILIKGNDALSLGALAAGLEFYVGYPISPATPVLVFMQKNLMGPGKFAYQISSEIEAITAVMGAGYRWASSAARAWARPSLSWS